MYTNSLHYFIEKAVNNNKIIKIIMNGLNVTLQK